MKRATIIGNPMFSSSTEAEAEAEAESLSVNSASQKRENDATPADLSALDDLQLDMDYDQIMHYFDNLKVRD